MQAPNPQVPNVFAQRFGEASPLGNPAQGNQSIGTSLQNIYGQRMNPASNPPAMPPVGGPQPWGGQPPIANPVGPMPAQPNPMQPIGGPAPYQPYGPMPMQGAPAQSMPLSRRIFGM